jgi:hypothetical protein
MTELVNTASSSDIYTLLYSAVASVSSHGQIRRVGPDRLAAQAKTGRPRLRQMSSTEEAMHTHGSKVPRRFIFHSIA